MKLDPITIDAIMRMFLDGLSVDEVLIALPTLDRSDVEHVRLSAQDRAKAQRAMHKLDRQMSPWAIK